MGRRVGFVGWLGALSIARKTRYGAMAQHRPRVWTFYAQLSHKPASLEAHSTTLLESTMIWKLLGLQKKLDALFDDGWFSLGLPTARSAKV